MDSAGAALPRSAGVMRGGSLLVEKAMVSEKLEAKLNELLNGEMEAHHVYTQAAAWASAHKF
ncbi:hypothetical protein [Xanthobacter sp.]|uniref:hypothetical protein n=1 Tax=Xanthobacter sp. TaxID=35809 RepID=UPI0035B4D62A